MADQVTLLQPAARHPATRPRSSSFPDDLLAQFASRLRILALLYAFVFFMAGMLPPLLIPSDRALFLGDVRQWGPGAIAITVALILAFVVGTRRLPLRSVMTLGLVFEVASSYAIATAEFGTPEMLDQHQGFMGLSWVAVWVVLFTVVVPTSPRRALVAALASVSAVPVIIGLILVSGATSLKVPLLMFFLGVVLPYLLVVCMAYVGARVIHHLGAEIKRARELGSYQLEEKLGQGGMGEVWRARHRLLARPAAIKLIRPASGSAGGVSEEALQRFEREAQVIARLRSPHTVNLFDYGTAADGVFYYVMELLDGLDADSLLRQFGPIPPERAIHLLRQVCHSLSEAESCGLVHRDVKPANIFVCRYGEDYDFVKVLDFGIVGAVREAAETSPGLTRPNAVHGTPAFIAPEQALGSPVDARADIYATGCVAYWMLTGELVFTADSPVGYIVHHAHTPATPPSARTELPIPRALDDLVMSCLEKDPAKRPASARELSRRLGEIACPHSWTPDRAREWWTTHRPMAPRVDR